MVRLSDLRNPGSATITRDAHPLHRHRSARPSRRAIRRLRPDRGGPAFPSQHRLDLQRRHEPAARRLRRPRRADAGARPACVGIDPLHARVLVGAGLRAEPRGDHHRHAPERDRRPAHADDRERRARAARAVSRRAAVLRQGVSRVPARRRLLHDQSRQDRLPVRRAVHDLGRSRRQRALAQSSRPESAVLLRLQPGDHAREPCLSRQRDAQGKAARHQPGQRRRAPVLPGYAGRSRRPGLSLRQHRGDGRPGRRDPAPAAGGRSRRQHDRRLLERSRRRHSAIQALALRLGSSRAADDPDAGLDRRREARRDGGRSRQPHRPGADDVVAGGGDGAGAHAGPRPAGTRRGRGSGLRLRRARSHGRRVRHDAIRARRAIPLRSQLSAGAAVRRAHRLSQSERDHAGAAAPARRRQVERRSGAVAADESSGGGVVRRRAPILTRSGISRASRRTAPRSNGCARRCRTG